MSAVMAVPKIVSSSFLICSNREEIVRSCCVWFASSKIVTSCPCAFRTWRNEFSSRGVKMYSALTKSP
ncbi:hypothetical protein ACVWWO_006369 [Bradyrhizobium sp. F1.13.1]